MYVYYTYIYNKYCVDTLFIIIIIVTSYTAIIIDIFVTIP